MTDALEGGKGTQATRKKFLGLNQENGYRKVGTCQQDNYEPQRKAKIKSARKEN